LALQVTRPATAGTVAFLMDHQADFQALQGDRVKARLHLSGYSSS